MEIGAEDHPDSIDFYKEILQVLADSNIRYMVGGTFALKMYTGILGSPKDMDIFCLPEDFPRILNAFSDNGFETEYTDARWLGKIHKGERYTDIIFSSVNQSFVIDDDWYRFATRSDLFGYPVLYIPAEELLWSKMFVQNRERYDGADINHLILRYGEKMDWHRLWKRVEPYWLIFYTHLLLFRFIYPSEKNIVPEWLMETLRERQAQEDKLPPPQEKICRGPLIDQTQYRIDVIDWGFKSYTIKTI